MLAHLPRWAMGVEAVLKRFELGKEAVEFIRSELGKGKELARCVSDLPLEEGRVVAVLPNDVSTDALVHFDSGGVASGQENGWLADFIHEYLVSRGAKRRICAFEHAYARRTDPWLRKRDLPAFFVGDNVYLLLEREASRNRSLDVLTEAHLYPGIGVLSSVGDQHLGIRAEATVQDATMQALARSADHILISAYDAEAWLVWSQKRK